MPSGERGGLKAAFAGFKRPADNEAERKLLGRVVDQVAEDSPQTPEAGSAKLPSSYQVATSQLSGGLTPRPLAQREVVRQLSFRCPVSVAAELRRKAAFNQLEQQQIIVEGLKRVLAELPSPPPEWDETAL